MTARRPWNVGITHLIKPPFDAENEAFNGNAKFFYFKSKNETGFLQSDLQQLDAFLIWTPSMGNETIRKLDNCQIVVRYGVGFDKIEIPTLQDRGIAFSNNPEYGPEDVADTAMGLILVLQRRLIEHDILARSYIDTWQENHLSPMLHSPRATVGVVGVGRIGISVIRRLAPFGYRVIGYDPYVSNGMFRALQIEKASSLDELVSQVDILTLHCPLTPETRGMINRKLLQKARSGLILVNTARGALIENVDFIEDQLRSGHLAGVGLDVLPDEPPSSHSLFDAWREQASWLRGRLVLTPHNAFFSDSSMYECRFAAAETARLFLEEQIHRNKITG
jgi:D-3-phosphoglycerate dehydrogenase